MTGNDRDNIEDIEEEISLDEPLAMADEEEEIELAKPDTEEDEEETISLIDDEELQASQVRAFGGAASKMGAGHKADFQRPLNNSGQGATRCRIFHSKLAATSLEYMEKQINDWVDSDPTIDIKQVGHSIGVMTGKTAETSLIVTVWY